MAWCATARSFAPWPLASRTPCAAKAAASNWFTPALIDCTKRSRFVRPRSVLSHKPEATITSASPARSRNASLDRASNDGRSDPRASNASFSR